jgi:hypothetical protein
MKRRIMQATEPSVVEIVASVTGRTAEDWDYLDEPGSGVGADYRFRHRSTGAEPYANLDQHPLTISVDGERLYDGPRHVEERAK